MIDRVKLLLLLGTALAAPAAAAAAEKAAEALPKPPPKPRPKQRLIRPRAAAPPAARGYSATMPTPKCRTNSSSPRPIIATASTCSTNVSVLDGTTLTRELRGTIGETLTAQAGVTASYFGPNASRPILRGFQGERVRVLTDGIGSFDVSNTSVDHAVAINPLLAERIEVLHGPTSLLYGSSAIGGVVNVIDTRIPRHLNDEPIHVEGIVGYGSAASEFNASAIADIKLTQQSRAAFRRQLSQRRRHPGRRLPAVAAAARTGHCQWRLRGRRAEGHTAQHLGRNLEYRCRPRLDRRDGQHRHRHQPV